MEGDVRLRSISLSSQISLTPPGPGRGAGGRRA